MSTTKIGANMANDQGNEVLPETTEAVTSSGVAHVKIDELLKLKESTRKLLCVLEELQSKTLSKAIVTDDLPKNQKISNVLKPLELLREQSNEEITPRTINDVIGANAMKMLEYQARALDCIIIEDEDDCSVYKKLTRKCHCLTRPEYNDFVIHFNEDTKFCTGVVGEIIKNVKIVKKFLYMGGCYTKNALLFLNEGLSGNIRHEKRNILQAITFADLCCVFDENTIVTFCICWPCKNEPLSAALMQDLAATFLCKLSQTEEGRRYINLNSKIACDIKKVLKKNTTKIEVSVIDALKSILETCYIAAAQPSTITYQCHPAEEDLGNRVLNSLTAFRQYMSIAEVFACLEDLLITSNTARGKEQLTSQLPTIFNLFKSMLLEYDDSAMNIVMTNIMNRLMDKSAKEADDAPRRRTNVVNIATEPVKMKHALVQSFEKKKVSKKSNNDKNRLPSKPCLARQNAKGDPPRREYDKDFKPNKTRTLNRSMRFMRDTLPSVIVVPIDEEK